MQSDSMLKRWYRRYNLELFGGELPDNVVVHFEACAAHGETYEIESDEKEPILGIRINPQCRTLWEGSTQSWARLVLIHECIHVKQWSNKRLAMHGKSFRDEWRRLCQFESFLKLL